MDEAVLVLRKRPSWKEPERSKSSQALVGVCRGLVDGGRMIVRCRALNCGDKQPEKLRE
jgi:hypothetical protein